MKNYLWIALFLMPLFMFAQLSVTTSTTDDTCNGNGAVSFTLDNTTSNYNYRFLLQRVNGSGPEDTKDETIQATGPSLVQDFNTLGSGNWNYTISESDGTGNTTGEQLSGSFIIEDENVRPNLTATAQPNCSNHDIIANASGGTFNSYELLDESNNVIRPEQASNVFTSVVAGSYRVVGITSCGTRVVQSINFQNIENNYVFRRPGSGSDIKFGFNVIKSCNVAEGSRTVEHRISLLLNNSDVTDDRFPITITYTVRDTNNAETQLFSTTYNTYQELIDGRDVYLTLEDDAQEIIASVTDNCNVTHEQVDAIDTTQSVNILNYGGNCGAEWFSITVEGLSFPLTLTFNSAPADFKPSDFAVDDQIADDNNNTLIYPTHRPRNTNNIHLGSQSNPLPSGTYDVTFSDECGNSVTKQWDADQNLTLYNKVMPSCEDGKVSATVYIGTFTRQLGDITNAVITNGPTNPNITYPYDVTPFIVDGAIYLESLVPGLYTFSVDQNENSCNVALNKTFNLSSTNQTNINVISSDIIPLCGAFDYTFHLESIHPHSTAVRIQRKSSNGDWIAADFQGSLTGGNTYTLNVDNRVIEGEYRVIFVYNSFTHTTSNGTQRCEFIYDEFIYDGGSIRLNNFYATQCTAQSDTYDLIIDARGAEPIEYKILSINGDTSLGTPYQTDAVFPNVPEGTYQIEIKDDCGNTERASLNITHVKSPYIVADLCNGEFGTLRTSGLTHYETRWYKNGTLISGDDTSDNILIFDPFDESTDLGSYYAEIVYTAGASCGPVITPTFNVTGTTATNPNAGNVINPNPVTTIIDNNGDDRTNLFNYIENYDNQGDWVEVSTNGNEISNLLVENEWYFGLASSGTYTFKHVLEGTCTGSSETTLIIQYTAPCDRPYNQGTPENFTNIGISNLDQHNVSDWPNSIPNGFIVLESNTKGFTITRITDPESTIVDAREGMLVFDTDADSGKGCFKLYDGSVWKCITKCGQ